VSKENARERQKYIIYKAKSLTPSQTKPFVWQTPCFKLKRVAIKAQGFSMQKIILPLKPK
jgi:hypothetical protein